MGRSITIHCIGHAPEYCDVKTGGIVYRLYSAMSKKEIAQARRKAQSDGLKIEFWYAQTKTGCRVLGSHNDWSIGIFRKVYDNEVKTPKLVICPVCLGRGRNGMFYCPVCDGSGITLKGYEKRWQDWQIAEMKARSSQQGG